MVAALLSEITSVRHKLLALDIDEVSLGQRSMLPACPAAERVQ